MPRDGDCTSNGAGAWPARAALGTRLKSGEPLLGTFLKSPDPMVAELLASSGFDLLIADLEHSALELRDLHDLVRAAQVWNVPTVVRISPEEISDVGRLLESGVAGIQVANVTSRETMYALQRSVQFRPVGVRGYSVSHRAAAFGRLSAAEFTEFRPQEIALIAQIETMQGVDMLPELLSGPGLPDVWFVGAVDLSCDLGHPGELDHDVVRDVLDKVAVGIISAGGRLGIFAPDERRVAHSRASGATLVVVGSDVTLLARQADRVVRTWDNTAVPTSDLTARPIATPDRPTPEQYKERT